MNWLANNFYLLIGVAIGIFGIGFLFLTGSKPGAKNLRKAIKNRSVNDVIHVLLTQRLFGFADTFPENKETTAREIIFFCALILVVFIALACF